MKPILITLAMLLSLKTFAQNNSDAIIGKWLKTNKEDLIIEVYKVNDEYKGRISWSKDDKKPVGFIMLENLRYDQISKEWEGGKIRDPNSSRSYNATASMNLDGTLELIGAIFFWKAKDLLKELNKKSWII